MGWLRRRLRKRSVSAPAALAVFERLEERLALRTPNDSFMKPAFRPGMPLNPQWNMELIQAIKAWDLFSGNKRNVVAVMDYGIDFAHEDFGSTLTVQGNLWDRSRVFADYARRGYDEVNGPWNMITRPQPEGATKPLPGEFQGNHAAGIIGALTNNRVGVAGINWQTQLFSSKIVDGARRPSVPVIQRAIDRIIEMRASQRDEQLVRAVAFGYTDRQDFGNPMPQFRRLVQDPLTPETGILVTVPAGDLGPRTTSYPAVYAPEENVLVVGATDQNDRPWAGNSNVDKIDIYAPGVNILSLGNARNTYPSVTGTRQAAAHVAGAISLIYEAAGVNNHEATWQQVKAAIIDGADRVNGILRLNIVGALRAFRAPGITGPDGLYERPPVNKVEIAIAGGTVTEGNVGMAEAVFTVTVGTPFTSPITVQARVSDGTATLADKDYLPVGSGGLVNVTIPAGERSARLVVRVAGDHRTEPNETIRASFVNLAETFDVTTASAEVTILNDDLAPQISLAGPVTVVEGTGAGRTAQVVARLSAPSPSIVSASVRTVAGTATEGVDYRLAAAAQRVVFAPGQTTQVVNIAIIGDSVVEPHETFEVQLHGPVNATLGSASAVVTIVDDDSPLVSGSPAIRRVLVGAATTMTFTISLSRPASAPVSVGYSAIDGTAVNGVDFTLAAGRLDFAPGERVKTITVPVAARRTGVAYPRTFSLRLADVVGGRLAGGLLAEDLRGTIV